jgi:hypothetical protein
MTCGAGGGTGVNRMTTSPDCGTVGIVVTVAVVVVADGGLVAGTIVSTTAATPAGWAATAIAETTQATAAPVQAVIRAHRLG